MSNQPVKVGSYAPAVDIAKYGYYASVLKPGMTADELSRAAERFKTFTQLTRTEVNAFTSRYDMGTHINVTPALIAA